MQTDAMDLLVPGRLAPFPAAILRGEDRDLLEPLNVALPGTLPPAPPPGVDRRALATALERANTSYGHPDAARLATKLADPATRVVVTGQQPGIFGGPLYTLSKALAAEAWAAALEKAGHPAIALFWIATEDHDWAESSRASWLPDGRLLETDLGEDREPLATMGMRTLGEEVSTRLRDVGERATSPRYRDWLQRLGRWYRPDARFGEAFAKLMAELLGEQGPLLVDSQLPELKSLQRPWLERLVVRRDQVAQTLARAEDCIVERGYRLQVRPQSDAAQIFLLRDGRRRVIWDEGGYRLRGREELVPIENLLETIQQNPTVVTPGALSRPAISDAVFGSSLQILGPGEMAYFAQAAAVYSALGVPAPAVALRPQLLLLDQRQSKQLDDLGVSAAELLDKDVDLNGLLTRGKDLDPGPAAKQSAQEILDLLREQALALDPGLEKAWLKTSQQVHRALDAFSSRVVSAAARKDEVRSKRARSLSEAIRPGGVPQERKLSVAHFAGRYGAGFVERIRQDLELDPGRIQVIDPT